VKKIIIATIFIFVISIIGYSILKKTFSPIKTTLCSSCNVLIIAIDALQATHVSYYGYERETTPTIDSIAKNGTTFKNAYSTAPWTVPSYMSIFTGLFPSEHKVVNKYTEFTKEKQTITKLEDVSPNVITLAEELHSHGYKTAGFTGDAGVNSIFGYGKGFDTYENNDKFGSIEVSSRQALEWLKSNSKEKFFLFLHGYDAHGQFKLPENYQGKFMTDFTYDGPYKGTPEEQGALREEGLVKGTLDLTDADKEFWRRWYDSKIFDADARFAQFWKEFEAMGLTKNTLVIVLSDHGTEFFEHNRIDHGPTLYNELTHIPLIITGPNIPKDKKLDAQVSLIDIAPTILSYIGITPSKPYATQLKGENLLPLIEEKTNTGHTTYTETDYRNYTHKRAIQTTDGMKLIMTMETGERELYNLNKDPKEQTDISQEFPQAVYTLETQLRQHFEKMGIDRYQSWSTGCLPVYDNQCK
jgi:choline-sulfatase